ncbi:MAG: hypothetical protein AB7N76_05790 [Planctomycetota bacterium]
MREHIKPRPRPRMTMGVAALLGYRPHPGYVELADAEGRDFTIPTPSEEVRVAALAWLDEHGVPQLD